MEGFMHRGLLLAGLLALAGLFGCGGTQEYSLTSTSRAPGGDGNVMLEEIEGGNMLVTVTLSHLPPPNSLGNGLTTYVVWFIGQGRSPQMAARLEYDPDTREASATATTPMRAFELRITAERNANVGSPSEYSVVQRRVGQSGD